MYTPPPPPQVMNNLMKTCTPMQEVLKPRARGCHAILNLAADLTSHGVFLRAIEFMQNCREHFACCLVLDGTGSV